MKCMLFNPSWWSYLEEPVEFILQLSSTVYFKLRNSHHYVKISCSRAVLCYILILEFWLLWLILEVRKHSGGWGSTYCLRWFLNLIIWKGFFFCLINDFFWLVFGFLFTASACCLLHMKNREILYGFLSGKILWKDLQCQKVKSVFPKCIYARVYLYVWAWCTDINNWICSWHNAQSLLMLLTIT